MERLVGLVVAAALLASLTACSVAGEGGPDDVDRPASVHQQTAATKGDALATREDRAVGEETTAAAPASWDYVAIGDSLAVGVGARRGYVDRYAANIESDTGARVTVVNLGVSGQTSSQLLYALRNDESMREALRGAEVITFNIGINDLGRAGQTYEGGACGGGDGQECLRVTVRGLEERWEDIVSEILSLSPTRDTIVRTAGLGYTPRVATTYEPYVAEVNRRIVRTADSRDVPYAQPTLDDREMSPDGVHPNDAGYKAIADGLRGLGYNPLGPPR